MTDIFISYARPDRPLAQWLAEAFEREGRTVWWDLKIVGGERFHEKIGAKLAAARCVVVIWSKASLKSKWVPAEAAAALKRDRLVAVSIGGTEPPVPFNTTHTIDLAGWRGDPAHPAYQALQRAVRSLLGRAPRPSLPPPRPDPERFSVVVAQVQNDVGQQLQDVIATDLSQFDGIHVVKLDQTMNVDGPSPADSERAAGDKARDYLDKLNAAVMIWGKILRYAGKERPELYLSVSRSKEQRRGRFKPTADLRLPQVFWSELADVLHLVIFTYDAGLREQEGVYLGDQLQPFIPKVRRLLERADPGRGWSDLARGLARISLGDALMLLGGQGGRNAPLAEATAVYRKALSELSRKRYPREWARAQNGLGISLWMLGSRHGDTDLLAQAVAAYRLALAERQRRREPLEWAQAWNDLGNTLTTLGQQETGTGHLEEAVAAFKTALLERTLEAKPLDWAQTQNNLGVALWRLGEREATVDHLEEAASALRASFKVYSRSKTPLDWSQTQNNLGLVLWTLGQRQGSADLFKAAVAAYGEALRERKQDKVPLLWAQTQNNLGLALWSLGESVNDRRRLLQAVAAFRHALEERTREQAAMDWAQTQNNLGAVLWSLGQRKSGTQELAESVQAYQNALTVYSRAKGSALDWAQTQHNLGNALTTLGERQNDVAALDRALTAIRAALREYDRDQAPMPWAQTQGDLGYTAYRLGERRRDSRLVREAAKAFTAAEGVYDRAGMTEYAEVFGKQAQVAKKTADSLRKRAKA